jgi:tRNA threonylcarbamoyl adenosine modification protein YjeE
MCLIKLLYGLVELFKTFISDSEADTQTIAKQLSELLLPGDVVLLEGGLGSGKTYLVKQLCFFMGVREDVTSPTFTLIQQYSGKSFINHMDFYRIDNPAELDQLGWEDLINDTSITFIEWPEYIEKYLKQYYKITIKFNGERRIFELSRI